MSARVSISIGLQATVGNLSIGFTPPNKTVTPTSDNFVHESQVIGTGAAEVLYAGDTSTAGILSIYNTDSTNYVTASIIASGSTPFCKIKAGETVCFRPSVPIYLIANTSPVTVQYLLLND